MKPIRHLLVATRNKGKVAEFRDLLHDVTIEIDDLAHRNDGPEVDEVGHTFRDNACLKASVYARHFRCWTLADDSGLAVDALGGKPGVHSARWAEMNDAGKGDADNNALLLKQLADVVDDKRAGRFVCVLALADELGRIVLTVQDSVEGRIGFAPAGTNGFGYDPLFFIPAMGKTTAQLSSDEKHAISHRGKAMRRLSEMMRSYELFG
jgi:XTP/dITP diphosphohydrolase